MQYPSSLCHPADMQLETSIVPRIISPTPNGSGDTTQIPSMPEENIAQKCVQGKVDDNDESVKMRPKDVPFTNSREILTAEEYRYMQFVDPEQYRSRRIIEMGSDNMINDAELNLAATLVHDAMEGQTVAFKSHPKYVRSYQIYKSWPLTYLLYIFIVVDHSLVIFEKPAIHDLALPYSVTMTAELLCLMYYIARTCHQLHWRGKQKFFKDMKNVIIIGIILVTLLDMLIYVILDHASHGTLNVRYSRALRPLVIVNFSDGRQIRRAWRNMRKTIKEVFHVIALYYFFIFVSAVIAKQIFKVRKDLKNLDGSDYFQDYMECVWELYVLVTTSNNPDVMLPAVNSNRWYCIFFFLHILICFYVVMNVFLSVAYHSYVENMKEEVTKSSKEKKKKLCQAFDVIKINVNGKDLVTYRIWKRLMMLTKRSLSKNQIDLLMLILDTNRSGNIARDEFMNVADLLNVPISECSDRTTWLESKFPKIYDSTASEWLKALVCSVYFTFVFDFVVVVQMFLIAFSVEDIEVLFTVLFFLEIMVKVYTFGPLKFFKKRTNWFDIIITGFSVVHVCGSAFYNPDDLKTEAAFQVTNVMRIMRILRLLVHIPRFRIIIDTLVNLSFSILTYSGIILIIFYMFAVIGIEIFHGKITYYGNNESVFENETSKMYCGAPVLKDTSYYMSGYCLLNFNDIVNAFLVLATVTFQNNWHIIAEAFVLVTSKAARIYFAVFFMLVSVILLEIIKAFVVDMFVIQYVLQKEGKTESKEEKIIKELGLGIDADTGLEISAPLSDDEVKELVKSGEVIPKPTQWSEKSSRRGMRKAMYQLPKVSEYVNKRKSIAPTLSRFDGIRFHIKKTGWTKIEVLLQQLYEHENDTEVTRHIMSIKNRESSTVV